MSSHPEVPGRNPEELALFLKNRLGDSFRTLVEYHPDSEVVHFVRSDIDKESAQLRLNRGRELYEGEQAASSPVGDDPAFGPLYASTHLFGGAIVIHILDESGSAIGFSMDHQVGGRLSRFVRECMDALYDSDPWTEVESDDE